MRWHRAFPVLVAAVPALLFACAESSEGGPATDGGPPQVLVIADGGGPEASCDACDAGDAPAGPFAIVPLPADPSLPLDVTLLALWGTAHDDVWAVGVAGTALHHDGTKWEVTSTGTPQALSAIWGSSSDDVWAFYNSTGLLRRRRVGAAPPAWVVEPEPIIDSNKRYFGHDQVKGAWGVPDGPLFVVGTFTDKTNFGEGFNFMGVRRPLPDGGPGGWLTVGGCNRPSGCTRVNAVWGASATDVWIAGQFGMLEHSAGITADSVLDWQVTPVATDIEFRGIWGSGPNDVWAVGDLGTVAHSTNATTREWTVLPKVTNATLRGVWGSGPNDVWAVGDDTTILHYDGKAWTTMNVAKAGTKGPTLYAVWGSGPSDVWFAGEVLMHFE